MWFIILLKNFHQFKIVELENFFKQKLITDSVILNKWKSFSGIVNKRRGPPENFIISPYLQGCVMKLLLSSRKSYLKNNYIGGNYWVVIVLRVFHIDH